MRKIAGRRFKSGGGLGPDGPGPTALDFADDEGFRPDALEWSVWVHDDAEKNHIKVTVARASLDDYASSHGHKDHHAVIGLLNARVRDRVRDITNRAIDAGRACAGHLELNGHDLNAMLDN